MEWSADNDLLLPAIDKKIINAKSLSGGKVQVTQNDSGIIISRPEVDEEPVVTVIELKIDGNALELKPVRVVAKKPRPVLPVEKVTASSVSQGRDKDVSAAKFAIDNNPNTKWHADPKDLQAWLELDLGKPVKIGGVIVDQYHHDGFKLLDFEVQIKDGDTWKAVLREGRLNGEYIRDIDTVTARYVRLQALKTPKGPSIWEFQVFGPVVK
ncbi:discoidin domain-containing protein [Verrucomicrobiota bacterium]